MSKNVPHFHRIDLTRVEASFSANGQHRALLRLPFLDRLQGNMLCVIGQNPSYANAEFADKTIHYIERFVYERFPKVSQILMLNLCSRVDTAKSATLGANDMQCDMIFRQTIRSNRQFLVIFGKLTNAGSYPFRDRAVELRKLLKGRTVYKIDLGTNYAPHPGNPKILYTNYSLGVNRYDFSDLDA